MDISFFTAGPRDRPYQKYRGDSILFIPCSHRLDATLLIAISPQIYPLKTRDLILPLLNQSRRPICPHDAITKEMSLALLLTRALLFALGLSAMPSNHLFFFVRNPYFSHLSPHSSSPHLYLRHSTMWSVICKVCTHLLRRLKLLRCYCLSSDATHFVDLHRPLLVFHAT